MFVPPRYAFIALDGRKSSDELYSKLADFGSVRVLSRLSELSTLFNELVCTAERQWEFSLAAVQSFQQSTVPPINSVAPSVLGSYAQFEPVLTQAVEPINNLEEDEKPPIDNATVSEQSIDRGQISAQVVDTVSHRPPDGIPTINVATVSEHLINNGTVMKEEIIDEEPEIITLGTRTKCKQAEKRRSVKEESINEEEEIDMPISDGTSTTSSTGFNQNAHNDYDGEGSSNKRLRIDEPISPQLVRDESIDEHTKAECRLCCGVYAVGNMQSHAKTHKSNGKYCCPVDNCNFSSRRRNEVTLHYRTHNMPCHMQPVNLKKPDHSLIARALAIKLQRQQKVVECFPTFFRKSVNGTVKRIR